MMDNRIYAMGAGFFLALGLVCTGLALAECDFDFTGNLTVTSNVSNFTGSVFTFNGTQGSYSFQQDDNLTNFTTFYTMQAAPICLQKQFFIINISSQQNIDVFPNLTINLSFIVSPVAFGNYSVFSWGVFGQNTTDTYLDAPMTYNYTVIFPYVTAGTYTQTFEVSNGRQIQYVTFFFNNTVRPEPRILKFEYPNMMQYGKDYKVSVFGDNFDYARIYVDGLVFNLTNESEFYAETNVYTLSQQASMTLEIGNTVKAVNLTVPIQTATISSLTKSLVLPAVAINQSSKFLLADFGVDHPVPLVVNTIPMLEPNKTADYTYFITDESGTINPPQAKQLYIYLTPQTAARSLIVGNITSGVLPFQQFSVEFVGSQFTNPPEANITYYEKPTFCKVKGDYATNATYHCEFDIPNPQTVNLNNLQSNEMTLLRENYETQIAQLRKDNAQLDGFRWTLIAAIIIVIVSFVIWMKWDDIRTWNTARGG